MTRHRHVRVTNPGRCYQLAFEFMENTHGEAVLVHGFPRLTAGEHAGERYGHAWSELLGGALVVDPCFPDYLIPAAAYYTIGQIDPAHCRRYTLAEARREVLRTGSWGPWADVPDVGSPVLFAEAG